MPIVLIDQSNCNLMTFVSIDQSNSNVMVFVLINRSNGDSLITFRERFNMISINFILIAQTVEISRRLVVNTLLSPEQSTN